jgi:hypothetical protein
MAAPTNVANVKKALANSEPSTHGTPMPQSGRRPQHQKRKFSKRGYVVRFTLESRPSSAQLDRPLSAIGRHRPSAAHFPSKEAIRSIGLPIRRIDRDASADDPRNAGAELGVCGFFLVAEEYVTMIDDSVGFQDR